MALERYQEAEELRWALPWLNPGDHLDAAELVPNVIARRRTDAAALTRRSSRGLSRPVVLALRACSVRGG
ncbi:MAG: hypothetical protein ABSG43_16485 [Solirubrobacteraceae bacterium]